MGNWREKEKLVVNIKPKEGKDIEELKAEVIQIMRRRRGLKPDEINTFFISVISGLQDAIDGIISTMNGIGWLISAFSLLVGGFGIANIMFVSVKERTNLIGIQKSLGAKNRFILFQFLFVSLTSFMFCTYSEHKLNYFVYHLILRLNAQPQP